MISRWVVAVAVALLAFLALLPVVPTPECTDYGNDVTGCVAHARSMLGLRVGDGSVGVVIALVVAFVTGLIAAIALRRLASNRRRGQHDGSGPVL